MLSLLEGTVYRLWGCIPVVSIQPSNDKVFIFLSTPVITERLYVIAGVCQYLW